jgi:hypothetical protein
MRIEFSMKRLLTAIRRAIAYYQMRSIEINLAGAIDTIPYIKDADTLEHMRLSIKRMSKELCQARARYQSFLPPGERHVWRVA